MNYEAYAPYKESDSVETRQKIEAQREILAAADLVLAVGPRLAASAREKLGGVSKSSVVELTPGLAEIQGVDHSERFSAVTFGRLDPRNDRVKQARLAVAAFGHAIGRSPDFFGPDPTMTVIGLSEASLSEETRELRKLAERHAGRWFLFMVCPTLNIDRNFSMICATIAFASCCPSMKDLGLSGGRRSQPKYPSSFRQTVASMS